MENKTPNVDVAGFDGIGPSFFRLWFQPTERQNTADSAFERRSINEN
jgi:hypothetical protein